MISIVVPVHDGELVIAHTLERYSSYFNQVSAHDFEIIVVPNACSDQTPQITLDCCRSLPGIVAMVLEDRIGKGGAIREGLKLATGDIVCFVDADGATSPEELFKLIQRLGQADGVIGSRWLPNSIVQRKQPLSRRIASRGFNLLVRLLFRIPYRDTQCGAKVFTRKAVDDILGKLEMNGFAFDVALLYQLRRAGYGVNEVPTVWQDTGISTLNLWKEIPRMFLAIAKLRLIHSPLKNIVAK